MDQRRNSLSLQPELMRRFTTTEGEVVEARVGTSFISIEQARQNLKLRYRVGILKGFDDALRATWNEKLGRIGVEGATDDQRRDRLHGPLSRIVVSAYLFGARPLL